MSHIDRIIHGLRCTVLRHEGEYRSAREREPALEPYPTACALFDALAAECKLDSHERHPVLFAIATQYRRARHPLWHALATRAFEPLLGTLRARVRDRDPEETEQQLQLALAECLAAVRLERRGATFPLIALQRGIARKLFGAPAMKRGFRHDDELPFDEGSPASLPSPHQDAQPFLHCLAREIGERLAQAAGDDGVVRVLAGAETLPEQAERLAAQQGGDVRTVYARQQRRQHRAVETVQTQLRGRRS